MKKSQICPTPCEISRYFGIQMPSYVYVVLEQRYLCQYYSVHTGFVKGPTLGLEQFDYAMLLCSLFIIMLH